MAEPDRRALWHDPLTNEQWFGLNAEDPVRVGSQVVSEQLARVRQLAIDHDAAFVYLTARLDAAPTATVRIGFDLVPDGLPLPGGGRTGGQNVAVVVDPAAHAATASSRADFDPLLSSGQCAHIWTGGTTVTVAHRLATAEDPRAGSTGLSRPSVAGHSSSRFTAVTVPARW